MSKDFAIKICLHRIKESVNEGNVVFVNRRKNVQALFDLEMTEYDVFQKMLELKVEDYISGPESDRDKTGGQLWKFRHTITGSFVYIKLKFYLDNKIDYLKILSFHPEEIKQ